MTRMRKSAGYLGQLTTANGYTIKQDGGGFIGIYNTSGTEIGYFKDDGSGNLVLSSMTGKANILAQNGTSILFVNTSGTITANAKFFKYNSLTLAGNGLASILAATSPAQSKSNAAPATVSYTPPATAGIYRASGFVEVTTGTTIALALALSYKSTSGASASEGVVFQQQGSVTALTAIVTTGYYHFSIMFGIDNSATAIAIADNAGTYTTCAYRFGYTLEQLV